MQRAILEKQDLSEIQEILQAGFNVDGPIGCGTFNSIDGAVAVGNVEILKFFLAKGAQPKGEALLHAVRGQKPNVSFQLVKVLLEAGADAGYKEYFPKHYVTGDTHKPDPSRFSSPLHAASYKGDFKVAELLLSRPGVELDKLDIDGRTPLMWAAEKGNEEVVRLLLSKGANANVKNGRGKTAADLVRRQDGTGTKISRMLANASTVAELGR